MIFSTEIDSSLLFWHNDSLMIFTTLIAAASLTFAESFPLLREQADWSEIVRLGEAAAAEIHGQLASSYFYQGDFESAKKHALLCLDQEKIHGLYLLSAVARAEGNFAEAKRLAAEALPLSTGELRAKVLFNLGAACADNPEGNLQEALSAFDEALTLFECPEDRQRTLIRLGKVHLLLGNLLEAEQISNKLEFVSERTSLHAAYLSAQIQQALGRTEEARKIASAALEQALRLGAKKDAERISAFLEGL